MYLTDGKAAPPCVWRRHRWDTDGGARAHTQTNEAGSTFQSAVPTVLRFLRLPSVGNVQVHQVGEASTNLECMGDWSVIDSVQAARAMSISVLPVLGKGASFRVPTLGPVVHHIHTGLSCLGVMLPIPDRPLCEIGLGTPGASLPGVVRDTIPPEKKPSMLLCLGRYRIGFLCICASTRGGKGMKVARAHGATPRRLLPPNSGQGSGHPNGLTRRQLRVQHVFRLLGFILPRACHTVLFFCQHIHVTGVSMHIRAIRTRAPLRDSRRHGAR